MDGLMPSGEACIRQFLYGQRFFQKEFGLKCKEFWLPDTFGYSGQFPQIMRHVGIERFLTQKLSWNLVNKFPHNTFYWHGIDGSSVLAHFPPGDDYTMRARVDQVLFSLKNFKDKGRSNSSMYLYGYGDGGQGPTADMIERLKRMEDTDECPKVKLSTPDAFFSEIEARDTKNLCHWMGELYLELHNGTYTTQAKTKNGNRKGEFLLQDVEALATMAHLSNQSYEYPRQELERLWKLLLLNQFHDVLPGSSINAVYKDALKHYHDIAKTGNALLAQAAAALVKTTDVDNVTKSVVFNTQGWPRRQVLYTTEPAAVTSQTQEQGDEPDTTQIDYTGKTIALVSAPSYGYNVLSPVSDYMPVTIDKGTDENINIENEHLKAVIDSQGRVVELYTTGSDKNVVAKGSFANQLVMFDDVPLYWDAWDVMDYHLETRKAVADVIESATILEEGPIRARIRVSLKISDQSYVKQYIILDAGCPYLKFETEVCWNESHKFLKVEFATSVLSSQATYEIAYGHLQRPTHFNTSWDSAKYEVCGHKWADLSEYGFGVSVLNDNKYGWSCINNVLRLSLLRSPKAPDEEADMGTQHFTYALMPHLGTFQEAGVIQAAYSLNNPLRSLQLEVQPEMAPEMSGFSIDSTQVILDTVKLSEDSDHKVVLRLYEAFGGSATVRISSVLPLKQAFLCNGLEEVLDEESPLAVDTGRVSSFSLAFKPFQIHSVLLLN